MSKLDKLLPPRHRRCWGRGVSPWGTGLEETIPGALGLGDASPHLPAALFDPHVGKTCFLVPACDFPPSSRASQEGGHPIFGDARWNRLRLLIWIWVGFGVFLISYNLSNKLN